MATKVLSAALIGTALGSVSTLAPATQPDIPPAPETRFLAVDGGRIAYDDTGGNGPLIVAIPGMGDLRSEYRLLRPTLQQAGYRVITMDVRGFGETSARWNDYSAHAVGRDALALLDQLDAGPAIILGNSFAAGSALWAAHDAPARVNGVVLLGPIVRDQKPSRFAKLALDIGFAGPWRVWFWTTYWDSLFPTRKPSDQAQAKAALIRNLREPGRMAALQAMISLSKSDTAAIVPQNRTPALVVMGTRDPDFADAAAEAQWLAGQLGAQSLIVEGAGHYPHTEMPDRLAPKLLSFIGGLHGNSSANL
ncbi:MAG TPA: alpha/beta hydrolase [Steroidobacteraceae bacterium]|jgi:pimeloyl-ACP methyl ester carboxylesterase|nr:alpha/beta hydrolase [Steroidobacteraceae bacterium]